MRSSVVVLLLACTALPSGVADESPDGLRAEIRAALASRVERTANYQYATTTELRAWPLETNAFFDRAGSEPEEPTFAVYQFARTRHQGSTKVDMTREFFKVPEGGGAPESQGSERLVNVYDAESGECRGILNQFFGEDAQTHAVVDDEPDHVTFGDRMLYWMPGFRHWQGVTAVDVLLKRFNAVTFEADDGPDRLVVATLEHRDPGTTGQPERLTVWLDPAKDYMPVRHEVRRVNHSKEPVWLERLEVLSAAETDGVWMPTAFQTIQSNMSGKIRPALYDTVVKSLSFDDVEPEDVAFRFPGGVRVVDRIREQWYRTAEDGTPAAEPVALRMLSDLDEVVPCEPVE
ncbi:hypothetical protein [Alienimonas sp. DA493]|uniref:hypothetical protein n=1 Tax=Alienimonas sp. DA493 TaxID=3373605 RepID=UPI00375405A6